MVQRDEGADQQLEGGGDVDAGRDEQSAGDPPPFPSPRLRLPLPLPGLRQSETNLHRASSNKLARGEDHQYSEAAF